ncbi:MAG TPA: hypothetical protein VGS22_12285 [Thermoanaerobaculia bacterium]|nr:hypothetical protein [Thermoanaerobaculia bacterium]
MGRHSLVKFLVLVEITNDAALGEPGPVESGDFGNRGEGADSFFLFLVAGGRFGLLPVDHIALGKSLDQGGKARVFRLFLFVLSIVGKIVEGAAHLTIFETSRFTARS